MKIHTRELPDGKTVIEIETVFTGGSETQISYAYFYDGEHLNHNYPFDYWGKIKAGKRTEKLSSFDVGRLLSRIIGTPHQDNRQN